MFQSTPVKSATSNSNGTQNGHVKSNGYSSKQAADYYATGEGLTRPDLVQRSVAKSN